MGRNEARISPLGSNQSADGTSLDTREKSYHVPLTGERMSRLPLKPSDETGLGLKEESGAVPRATHERTPIELDPDGSLALLLQAGVVADALQLSSNGSVLGQSSTATPIVLEQLEGTVVNFIRGKQFEELANETDRFVRSGGDARVALETVMSVAWRLHLRASDYWSVFNVTFKLRMVLLEVSVDGEQSSILTNANSRELLQKIGPFVRQSSLALDGVVNEQILSLYTAFGMTDQAYVLLQSLSRAKVPVGERSYIILARRLSQQKRWSSLPTLQQLSIHHIGSVIPQLLDAKARAYLQLQDHTALKLIPDEYAHANLIPEATTYDAIIQSHLENSDVRGAKEAMGRMVAGDLDLKPTQKTIASILKGSLKLGLTDEVRSLIQMATASTGADAAAPIHATATLNAGLKLYHAEADDEGMERLLRLFDFQPPSAEQQQRGARPTAQTLAIMIDAHARRRELNQAIEAFGYANALGISPSTAMTTALLNAHISVGDLSGALYLVEEMCRGHELWDETTMAATIQSLKQMTTKGRPQTTKWPREPEWPFPPHSASLTDWRSLEPVTSHFTYILDAALPRAGVAFAENVVTLMKALGLPTKTPSIVNKLLRYSSPVHPTVVSKILPNGTMEDGTAAVNSVLESTIRNEKSQILPKFDLKRSPATRTPSPPVSALISSSSPNNIHTSLSAGIDCSNNHLPHMFRSLRPQINDLAQRGVQPDRQSYALRIRREAVNRGNLLEARAVFDTMISRGMKPQQHHYAALMEGHARHGDMDEAKWLMQEYQNSIPPSLDQGDYTGEGTKHGHPQFVRSMTGLKRAVGHVLLWTILIFGFGRIARPDQSRVMMEEMVRSGVKPDLVAINTLADAYAKNGQYSQGWKAVLDFWPVERVGPLTEELRKLPLKKLLKAMWMKAEDAGEMQIPGKPTRWRGFTKKEGLELKEGLDKVVTLMKGDAVPMKDGKGEKIESQRRPERIKRPHGGVPRAAVELQGRRNMPRYRAVPWPKRL
ncbi:hypothetical protein FRB95_012446 [Tulasnella sp. JGI-2019a]|nr:hypothetical protein FRB95_012446 [Tulasnella sp. JGI-2019a]